MEPGKTREQLHQEFLERFMGARPADQEPTADAGLRDVFARPAEAPASNGGLQRLFGEEQGPPLYDEYGRPYPHWFDASGRFAR